MKKYQVDLQVIDEGGEWEERVIIVAQNEKDAKWKAQNLNKDLIININYIKELKDTSC